MVKGFIPLAEARSAQAEALTVAIDTIEAQVRKAQADGLLAGPGPIFLGMGASLAASAAAVWVLRGRGIDSWRLGAGEHPLPFPASPHPLIGVSQSGKSAETLAVLQSVGPTRRLSVVNVKDSPIAGLSRLNISLGAIPDSYASTIGYTATVVALGMIAEAWDNGAVDRSWSRLPQALRSVETMLAGRVGALVRQVGEAPYADCVGQAASVGTAEVGALLLREVARLPSTGMSTRQYLHGAMESAGRGIHILFGDEREVELAHMLANAGHETILVGAVAVKEEPHLSHLTLPRTSPAQRPVLEALVMQSLAIEIALARGLDPDAFVFHHNDTKVT